MEISRSLKPVQLGAVETATVRAQVPTGKRERQQAGEAQLSLEPLQESLNALPDVDLARVQEIKQALQRGEIPLDAEALAASILAYHGGKRA
jgi:negative regulator of flagellin synthesis FlgM